MFKKRKRKKPRKFFKRYTKSKRDFDDPAYKAVRSEVRKRDGNKCRIPGCKSRATPECHHIIKWSQNLGLRLCPKNIICVCPTHHKQITGHEEVWASFLNMLVKQSEKEKDGE